MRRFLSTLSARASAVVAKPVIVPQLSSDGQTVYEVAVWPGGHIICDARCKGYSNRRRCRHVESVKEALREVSGGSV
jgi:hypothetical protein